MKRRALVVIDMQNDFVTGPLGTKEAQAIVPKLTKFIKNFKGDVYFTQDTHYEDYLASKEGKHLPVSHCIKGTEGWELINELRPYSTPMNTYDKPTFGSTFLAMELHRCYYDEIYFVGVCTGICVITNAVLSKTYDYNDSDIYVIEDLCACVTLKSHKTALEAMKLLQIEIVNSNEVNLNES